VLLLLLLTLSSANQTPRGLVNIKARFMRAFYLGKYMMTSIAFTYPTQITQVSSTNNITGRPSIDWNFDSSTVSPDNPAYTLGTLYTMSGFWQEKFFSQTSELVCTNFNFQNLGTVTGIELELTVQRVARIQDLVIQLTLNGELIGDNMASIINPVQADMYTSDTTVPLTPINDFNIYGGPTNMWGTTLTAEDIMDPSFGVILSFRSNVIYPHNDTVYLDQVALRITYA
jgi:hypothetical protein